MVDYGKTWFPNLYIWYFFDIFSIIYENDSFEDYLHVGMHFRGHFRCIKKSLKIWERFACKVLIMKNLKIRKYFVSDHLKAKRVFMQGHNLFNPKLRIPRSLIIFGLDSFQILQLVECFSRKILSKINILKIRFSRFLHPCSWPNIAKIDHKW